jgi:hypothetical protein
MSAPLARFFAKNVSGNRNFHLQQVAPGRGTPSRASSAMQNGAVEAGPSLKRSASTIYLDQSDEEDTSENRGGSAGRGPSSRAATRSARPECWLADQLAGMTCRCPADDHRYVDVNADTLAYLANGEYLNDTCLDAYIL